MSLDAFIIVSPAYLPHMGGVERYSWNLAGELRERGYAVYIICSSMKGEPQRSLDSRGIVVLRYPSIWVIPGRMPVALPTNRWKKLQEELEQYDSVKLIAQTNLYLLSLKSLSFADHIGINSMMIIHGSNYVCLGQGLIDRIEHKYERWIANRAKKNQTVIAAVSKASSSFAEMLGFQVKTIAYNAIRYEEIEGVQADDQETIREYHRLSASAGIFVFVGRMIREKGVRQLADAFSRLAGEHQDACLIMIGDGPLLPELRNRGIKGTVFTGQLPHRKVIQYLKQADCFILPSDSEGFPTVILEAADCDCFVITAPYGGQKETAEMVNGYIMKDNSAESIYHACQYYLDNRVNLLPGIQSGKLKMKKLINWQNTVKNIMNAFEIHEK